MIQVPNGRIIERIASRDIDLEGYLYELCEGGFTGSIKCIPTGANILLLEGGVAAATFVDGSGAEISGDGAFISILEHADKTDMAFDVGELDISQAAFSLKWYTDIHRYEAVTRKPTHKTVKKITKEKEDTNDERKALMDKFGIPEPDSDCLKGVLKRSGITLVDN